MDALHVFKALDLTVEVELAVTPQCAWEALTSSIVQWWPEQFYVGPAPRGFVVEGFVGGRVFEDADDGKGVLFGTVTALHPPQLLQWAADMSAEYGGPARTITTIRVRPGEANGTCIVSLRDTPHGCLAPAVEAGLEQGWRWLLEHCLKPWVERGIHPKRPQTVEAAIHA